LNLLARARIDEIKKVHHLDDSPIGESVAHVDTVNSDECRSILEAYAPAVVVVNGTRIISAATIDAVPAPFLNMHAGITPLYRGVHGGYWALVDGRRELVGTTVHLVDTGIDTGGVIAQPTFEISSRDSFVTYPYLHLAAGLPCLREAIRQAINGELRCISNPRGLASQLRYHPTAWGYLLGRLARGVR
jgi:methionyl-tRNA formyltransferase